MLAFASLTPKCFSNSAINFGSNFLTGDDSIKSFVQTDDVVFNVVVEGKTSALFKFFVLSTEIGFIVCSNATCE